ncbi:MAG: hypothetical protein H6868_02605 [Rhodospirillales bacterium]|nr:hypothetical protein [Rhodospirillales bacterium]
MTQKTVQKHHKGKGQIPAAAVADSPVLKPLVTQMHFDLVVNEQGQAWVLHDKPLPSVLQWVEYDRQESTLTLILQGGKLQNIGMNVEKHIDEYLKDIEQICVAHMKAGTMADFGLVPLLVRDIVWH